MPLFGKKFKARITILQTPIDAQTCTNYVVKFYQFAVLVNFSGKCHTFIVVWTLNFNLCAVWLQSQPCTLLVTLKIFFWALISVSVFELAFESARITAINYSTIYDRYEFAVKLTGRYFNNQLLGPGTRRPYLWIKVLLLTAKAHFILHTLMRNAVVFMVWHF